MPRYAAIDVGSNSIRMEAAELTPGTEPKILASDREVTRLGESVFRTGRLSEEAMQLACTVLARMAAKIKTLDVVGARAVATSSVRDARNQAEFLARASEAAGVPVEVVSGREEARLIHLGVRTRWPNAGHSLLMVDIGGGSAEIIRSEGGHVREAVSKPLGAIRLKEIFLTADPPAERQLHQMREYIEERLAGAVRRFGHDRYDRAIATSATAAAVVCAVNGVPRPRRDGADRLRASTLQVQRLFRRIRGLDLAHRRRVPGVGPRRAEIIVSGTAVLLHVLEAFRLPSVYYSAAGVRDGIIADLALRGVGRELWTLSRDERVEVEKMSVRCGVSREHVRAVASYVEQLFHCLLPLHQLPPVYCRLLEAAAYLHDTGHLISDSSHHKHSYYIVANSDMPGFTAHERAFIANLCRYHRKVMPAADHTNNQGLNAEEKRALTLLIPLLRLADNLDRSKTQRVSSIECAVRDGGITLQLASKQDINLELWAAERVSDLFQTVYGRPLVLGRVARTS